MAYTDYGELFCEAVDTIIKERLAGVSYDTTILCTVVDDTDREKGKYVVSNGSAKFEAYSTDTSYREDDNVYIQIPSGDYNQQKFIVAKKSDDETAAPITYKDPFTNMVDITTNIAIDNRADEEGNRIEKKIDTGWGLVANQPDTKEEEKSKIHLWSYNLESTDAKYQNESAVAFADYTRLGIQANFQAWLNPLGTVSGSYGLLLRIKAEEDTTFETFENKKYQYYELELDASDMNGNPYNFESYFQQRKVFDISDIHKIVGMELVFYEEPGSFKDKVGKEIDYTYKDVYGGDVVVANNLFVKDVYICLGYDVDDYDDEMVILYTFDSSTFAATSDASYNTKTNYLRWVHQKDDGNFISVTEDASLAYSIYWYQYELGHASADNYSGVYWKHLARQDTDENNDSQYYIYDDSGNEKEVTDGVVGFQYVKLSPDTTMQSEQIKAIVVYNGKPYRSNILKYENEKEVVNKATVEAIAALTIECEDSTYGNYRIYQLGGSLIDSGDSSVTREFKAYFNSAELTEAQSIEWIIPTTNTMIVVDSNYYSDATNTTSDGYIHIVRKPGSNSNIVSTQHYRINSYYTQSYSNNTIQCIVTKDNIKYSTTKELTFGVAGTSGTDCTLVLDFDGGVTAMTIGDTTNAVQVTARLYDYENQEVDLSNYTIEWEWKNGTNSYISINETDKNYTKELKLTISDSSVPTDNYSILQATVENWGDYSLVAYLPIPIRLSNKYTYINGATTIIYDSDGTTSSYYSKQYQLHKLDDNGNDTIILGNWAIANGSTKEKNYTPNITTYTISIDEEKHVTKGQHLVPTSVYVENTCSKVCVYGKETSDDDAAVVWSQPLLIMQNRYPAAMINNWDGSLTIDEENNTILSASMIAGKKESDNTFSGVVLGSLKQSDGAVDSSIAERTGIYGYYKGKMSYAFKDNGKAFIGTDGSGRIEFDGTNGIIKSSSYSAGSAKTDSGDSEKISVTAGKGMEINLKDGTINAANMVLHSQNFELDSSEQSDGKFTFKVGEDGRFKIIGSDKTLMNFASKNCYLQSNNYSASSTNTGAGMKINLSSGSIDAYDFKLTSNNLTIDSKTNGTDGGTFSFNVGKSGQFKIKGKSGSTEKTLMSVNSNHYYLQSANYTYKSSTTVTDDTDNIDSATGGTRIDLTSGRIYCNSAILSGKITAESGKIGSWTISDSDTDRYSAGALFLSDTYETYLGSDGSIKTGYIVANEGGSIGGWEINSDGLYSGTSKDTSRTVLYNSGTIKCKNLKATTEGTIGGWSFDTTRFYATKKLSDTTTSTVEITSTGNLTMDGTITLGSGAGKLTLNGSSGLTLGGDGTNNISIEKSSSTEGDKIAVTGNAISLTIGSECEGDIALKAGSATIQLHNKKSGSQEAGDVVIGSRCVCSSLAVTGTCTGVYAILA